jgi:hypothetical protein
MYRNLYDHNFFIAAPAAADAATVKTLSATP